MNKMVLSIVGFLAGIILFTLLTIPGGGGMLTLLAIIALGYYAYRTSKRVLNEQREENEYSSFDVPVKEPVRTATSPYERRNGGSTLSSTEEEIWNLLTDDMKDLPKADEINYEDFDPPIPLKWSTLNPFHKNK